MDISVRERKGRKNKPSGVAPFLTHLVIPPMLIQQGDDGLDVALCYQV